MEDMKMQYLIMFTVALTALMIVALVYKMVK